MVDRDRCLWKGGPCVIRTALYSTQIGIIIMPLSQVAAFKRSKLILKEATSL